LNLKAAGIRSRAGPARLELRGSAAAVPVSAARKRRLVCSEPSPGVRRELWVSPGAANTRQCKEVIRQTNREAPESGFASVEKLQPIDRPAANVVWTIPVLTEIFFRRGEGSCDLTLTLVSQPRPRAPTQSLFPTSSAAPGSCPMIAPRSHATLSASRKRRFPWAPQKMERAGGDNHVPGLLANITKEFQPQPVFGDRFRAYRLIGQKPRIPEVQGCLKLFAKLGWFSKLKSSPRNSNCVNSPMCGTS